MPRALALELLLTGDPIDAARAAEIGLVNRVVPEGGALEAAIELGQQVARNGPLAVRTTKFLFRRYSRAASELGPEEARLSAEVFGSAYAQEGARAFAEKRPPMWTGA